MSAKSMELCYIILLTVLSWTAVPVKVRVDLHNFGLEEENRTLFNTSEGNRTLTNKPEEMVYANVYGLNDGAFFKAVNTVLFAGGAYHIGIEAFGLEAQYGGTVTGTGVSIHDHPRTHTVHKYYESYELGRTSLTKSGFIRLVEDFKLNEEWTGNLYHPLYKNCQTFAEALLEAMPEEHKLEPWMTRLMHVGRAVIGKPAGALGVLSKSESKSEYSKSASETSRTAASMLYATRVCATRFEGACGELSFEVYYRSICPLGQCCHKTWVAERGHLTMCSSVCPGIRDDLYANNVGGACNTNASA